MALGKAFIEVHADTKPFARELGVELEKAIKDVEKSGVRQGGERIGKTLGEGISKGIGDSKGKIGDSVSKSLAGSAAGAGMGIFATFSKGIIDSIDDGLSGLPAELKVALGAALLAVTPLLGAGLAGLISGSLALAFGGIGFLIALQFEQVRNQGAAFVSFMRTLFVSLGQSFIEPVLKAFTEIRARFTAIAPEIARVFEIAAGFIEPLVDGFVGFFENLLPGLEESLTNAAGLVDTLGFHFKVLGATIGEALMIITGSNSAEQGLNDILTVLESIIIMSALLIRTLTELYAAMTKLGDVFSVLGLIGFFRDTETSAKAADTAVGGFSSSMTNAIAPTSAEEKALKEINDEIKRFTTNTANAWQSNINFEKSLDDTTETLRKHRGELDLNSRGGQAVQQALLNTSQALIKQRDDYITLGGSITQANTIFEANRKRLEEQANAAGISDEKFRGLTDAILKVPPAPQPTIDPKATASVANASSKWSGLSSAIQAAINIARVASVIGILQGPQGGAHIKRYADGGVVTSPTLGLVGEAGPEAIIPLSNPARAAQVMNEAGLTGAGMAGGVTVYIGERQIDAYIDSRVDRRLNMTARTMAYGSRVA